MKMNFIVTLIWVSFLFFFFESLAM
jgi:hypothetical protein